jgi:hypothetical protein
MRGALAPCIVEEDNLEDSLPALGRDGGRRKTKILCELAGDRAFYLSRRRF